MWIIQFLYKSNNGDKIMFYIKIKLIKNTVTKKNNFLGNSAPDIQTTN